MATVYKQKGAPSCPSLRMVLSGLAQEVELLQAGSPGCLFWPPSKGKGKGNPWATREQPTLRIQRPSSSAERFCNTGRNVDLGEQKLGFYIGCPSPQCIMPQRWALQALPSKPTGEHCVIRGVLNAGGQNPNSLGSSPSPSTSPKQPPS